MPDAWEMEYFGDLSQTGDTTLMATARPIEEYRYSGLLNPRRVDSDGDGLTDGFEYIIGPLPRTGKLLNPPQDSDGDGYSDGEPGAIIPIR